MAQERIPFYGGQALIEGVLMRGTKGVAAAMRDPQGKIVIVKEDLGKLYQGNLKKYFLIRGLIGLWDALGLGTHFLTLSANVQTGEDEKIEGPSLWLSLGGAFLIGIAIFFLLPAAIGQFVEVNFGVNSWLGNLLEGVIRLLLMLGYIWGIGKMPDIARVFAYHGAEHKTINAFEAHAPMTPESVQNYSVEHPRCGTGFLLTVVLLSILLFALLGPLSIFWRLASRILLIPVLAGISYEYIRFTAAHIENPFIRGVIKPNLMLQHLTTREPTLDMLEVSIASFNAMLEQENTVL